MTTPKQENPLRGVDRREDCEECREGDGLHGICPVCGFHGTFWEPGESIACPECGWGHAT